MTDQTKAPERIWAAECRQTHSTMWWPDSAGGVGTEYIRADLSDAKDKRIEELEDKNKQLCQDFNSGSRARSKQKTRIEELEAKLAKAVDALAPFSLAARHHAADAPEWGPFDSVSVQLSIGYLRDARTTLAELKGTD